MYCKKRDYSYFNDDSNYVYMVMFNTIKKDGSNILIYNYRAYNKLFIKLLNNLYFLLLRMVLPTRWY